MKAKADSSTPFTVLSKQRGRGRPRKEGVLSALQRQAIALERRYWNDEQLCCGISAAALARRIGCSTVLVWRWRNHCVAYKDALKKRKARPLLRKLEQQDRERRLPSFSTPAGRAAVRLAAIRKFWEGPVQSMQDGEIYDTPEAYDEHLERHGLVLAGQLSKRLVPDSPQPGVTIVRIPWPGLGPLPEAETG